MTEGSVLAGGALRRNVALNLVGHGLPLLAALAAVPPVLGALGEARFGLLALAWALLGLFGVFDLGVGRALTKLAAERLGRADADDLPELVSAALSLCLVLGVVAAACFALAVPVLVRRLLEVPAGLEGEAVAALRLLAAALPLASLGACFRGLLEAGQRFGLVNAVRIPMAVALFAGPLVVIPFSPDLVAVMVVLVAARLAALVAFAVLARRVHPWRFGLRRRAAASVLHLGGWMTVSNLLAPMLLYLDRFVVGAVVSMAAVAHYATPFEVVHRLSVVPAAMMGVLFPAFSRSLTEDRQRAWQLWRRSELAIGALLLGPVVVVMLGARPLLTAWLGEEFAAASSRVAMILAAGVLIHGLAQPSFHLLQAAGRPDVTARLHLVEAPVYLVYLWLLTTRFGIVGTACAWLVRVTLSAVVLSVLVRWCVLPGRARTDGAPP